MLGLDANLPLQWLVPSGEEQRILVYLHISKYTTDHVSYLANQLCNAWQLISQNKNIKIQCFGRFLYYNWKKNIWTSLKHENKYGYPELILNVFV